MLIRLTVKDYVLIDSIELSLDPGFTVLTGETGAGKSILLGAISLILGGRFSGGAGWRWHVTWSCTHGGYA